MTELDIAKLPREELEEEYKLSQWALTWALHKLGGSFSITATNMREYSVSGRVWYSTGCTETGEPETMVEFRELEAPRIILPH